MINTAIYLMVCSLSAIFYSALVGFNFGLSLLTKYNFLLYLYLVILVLLCSNLYSRLPKHNRDYKLITLILIFYLICYLTYIAFEYPNLAQFINFKVTLYLFYLTGALGVLLNVVLIKKPIKNDKFISTMMKIGISIIFGFTYYILKPQLTNDLNTMSQIFLVVSCITLPSLWVGNWILIYVFNRHNEDD